MFMVKTPGHSGSIHYLKEVSAHGEEAIAKLWHRPKEFADRGQADGLGSVDRGGRQSLKYKKMC